MKNAKETVINGKTYTIQIHPWTEGSVIAFELDKSIRAHVLASQKASMRAMSQLSDHDLKRVNDAPTEEERSKVWAELVLPKIDQTALLDGAVDFLKSIEPEKMSKLVTSMFKYVSGFDPVLGVPYKNVIPLMKEVIEHNDFLDLDASELLQVLG